MSREERDAQRRERLLRAAVQVAVTGPLTVARIVAVAGVGRSTFYEFFDDPAHIALHAELRAVRALEVALARAVDEGSDTASRMRAATRLWSGELDRQPSESRLALLPRPRSSTPRLLSRGADAFLSALLQIVETSRGEGEVLAAASELRCFAAAAAVEALSRRHLGGPALVDVEAALADVVLRLTR